ncbi:tripartite tricarboxylate transporter TctB family protein, partial [Agrococcus casei]
VLAITGIGLSLAQLIVAVVRPAPEREDLDALQSGGYRRVGATLIATALFVVAWNIGTVIAFGYRIQLFPIAATVFLAVLIAIYGARSWKAYAFFPLPMAMLSYLLFSVVLRIPL